MASDVRPQVDILMSTYNGEKHLAEQLDSILTQSYPNWILLIRDDGSSDNTLAIIRKYQAAEPRRIQLVENQPGKNLGYAASFMSLLQQSHAPFAMFCDQDDVWLPEKIAVSVAGLRQAETVWPNSSLLLHTDAIVADGKLKVISDSLWKRMRVLPDYSSASAKRLMAVPLVSGNSIALNAQARTCCLPAPASVIAHDTWISVRILARAGRIINLPVPTLVYRRHDGATSSSGRKVSFWTSLKNLTRLGRLITSWRRQLHIAQAAGIDASAVEFIYRKLCYITLRQLYY